MSFHQVTPERWSVLWRSKNSLDGDRSFIMWENCSPLLFQTRDEARRYIRSHWGYIAKRRDLRREPHGWFMPKPIKVRVILSPLPSPEESMSVAPDTSDEPPLETAKAGATGDPA